jgi:CBS-domain-containing membrane protein
MELTGRPFFEYVRESRFAHYKYHYIAQCLMATMTVHYVLLFLNALSNAVVVASIGATAFVAFTSPHRRTSQPRYIMGGYAIGMVVSTLCYFLSVTGAIEHLPFFHRHAMEFFGAISVGLTMFVMLLMKLEHPPAAGLALGLVLREWSPHTLLVTTAAIGVIVLFQTVLKKYLIDLC